MAKELIINQTLNESRVALVENGEVLDFVIDRHGLSEQEKPSVGNIYLGKILRVLPGMQSAFVDIGYAKAAFLYVHDAYIPTLEEQRDLAARAEARRKEEVKLGKVIPDEMSTLSEAVDLKFRPDVKIEDILKEGDSIVVQVAKEPIATKGPRITCQITMAGRYVVYMPVIEHTGVSRRIENEVERDRLRDVLDSIKPEGAGIIARTVADGQSHKVLKSDYNMLMKIWKDVQKANDEIKAPALLHKDLSFIQKSLRDITDEDVDSIIVDDRGTMKVVEKFVTKFFPSFKGKVKFWEEDVSLFEKYGIDIELERAISHQVYLKSGGHLTIDQTEALVSIDVNTGKFVGKKTLEDTILKTNLEAVKEISYQLRIRNCGGIIICDFIDMEKLENREQVYNAFLEALKKDRAKTNVLPISGLGLIEMTRKRTRDTLTRIMCEPCPYCEGTGVVKSVTSVCYEVLRELYKVLKKSNSTKLSVFAHPEVSAMLTTDLGILEMIEESFEKDVTIRADNNYHIEQYEIYTH